MKNLHLEHLEDEILNRGRDGVATVITTLQHLTAILDNGKEDPRLSVKWDGAPSVFVGRDPVDNKTFVAKKGIFNKEPEVYKHRVDILEKVKSEELQEILSTLLEYAHGDMLPSYAKCLAVQGDVVYTEKSLKLKQDGGFHFHPKLVAHQNTIAYAFDAENRNIVERMRRAKMGIAWHTVYVGDNLKNMRCSIRPDAALHLERTPAIEYLEPFWYDKADGRWVPEFHKRRDFIENMTNSITELYKKIRVPYLNQLSENTELVKKIKRFHNNQIRTSAEMGTAPQYVGKLLAFIENHWNAEIDKVKTAEAKARKEIAKKEEIDFLECDLESLCYIVNIRDYAAWTKNTIVALLDAWKGPEMETYILVDGEYKPCQNEGFVFNTGRGNPVKLVNRAKFSFNNFSLSVTKGWTSPSYK